MLKTKLQVKVYDDIIQDLSLAFNSVPIIPRDCIKSMNSLLFNMQNQIYSSTQYKEIMLLILKGFSCKDQYLRIFIYYILIEFSKKTKDGILAINCLMKDLDDKKTPNIMKNAALRAFFSTLPINMHFDFEKYIKIFALDEELRDNAIIISSLYFKSCKFNSKPYSDIRDYHSSIFTPLPINKYSSMVLINKQSNEGPKKVFSNLFVSADPIIFIESIKYLLKMQPEVSAPYIEKSVEVLRTYLKKSEIEIFTAIKALNALSVNFPSKVCLANREMESLVSSKSKSVSMFAILTLLKTGNEDTVQRLAIQLEPLLCKMPTSYKIIAVDTMERLAKRSKKEYVNFLKKCLQDGGELSFKRHIIKKMSYLFKNNECKESLIKFLCLYLEDPEHYQLSMDILGILGSSLNSEKDLIHIFNRLILDNGHVRKCAIQAIIDIIPNLSDYFKNRKNSFFTKFKDEETNTLCEFLEAYENSKRESFDLTELGELKEDVMKYLDPVILETETSESSIIKECRSFNIAPPNADFIISIQKRIEIDKIILKLTIENQMEKVKLRNGVIKLIDDNNEYILKITEEDFKENKAFKEILLIDYANATFNGIFEYEIFVEDDSEFDSLSLEPFRITLLDFVKPSQVSIFPNSSKSKEIILNCNSTEALSRILEITNMFLTSEKNSFELSGFYKNLPLVIKGSFSHTTHCKISMTVYFDDLAIIDKIIKIFE